MSAYTYPTTGGGSGTVTASAPLTGDGSSGDPLAIAAGYSVPVTGTASTSGAATSTMLTIATTTDTSKLVDLIVVARSASTGDEGRWQLPMSIKNIAGTVSVVDFSSSLGTPGSSDASMATASLAATVSGTNVLIRGTGIAGLTVAWAINLRAATTV